jgi:hypothetical protein
MSIHEIDSSTFAHIGTATYLAGVLLSIGTYAPPYAQEAIFSPIGWIGDDLFKKVF